jgi:hypothetical protein
LLPPVFLKRSIARARLLYRYHYVTEKITNVEAEPPFGLPIEAKLIAEILD